MLQNNSIYFIAISATSQVKLLKFELKVVGMGILGTGFCFQSSHYLAPISLLSLISLTPVLL